MATMPDVQAAIDWLTKAILRHERHMNGTEPTSDASQMKMMDEMKNALAALTGDMDTDKLALDAMAKAQVSVGNVTTFEYNGQKYGKFFLISPKVNSNLWETPAETIAAFARSFIGKPFVSDDTGATGSAFDHLGLQPPYNRPVEEIVERQEKPDVKAGTIIDVTYDVASMEAFAIVKFEDTPHGNKVYEDLKNGVAIYTSPAITGYADVLAGGRLRYKEWWGVHLARVQKPAYGVMAASLKQTCEGPEKKCVEMLARAASAHGSFCPSTGKVMRNSNSSLRSATGTRSQKMPGDDDSTNAAQLAKQVKELTDQVASLTKERDTFKAQAQTASDLGKKFDDLSSKYAKIEEGEKTKVANEIADMKVEAELIPKDKRDAEVASLLKLDLANLTETRGSIKPYVEKIKALASKGPDQPSGTRSNFTKTVKQVETASEHESGSESRGIETLGDVSDIVDGRF